MFAITRNSSKLILTLGFQTHHCCNCFYIIKRKPYIPKLDYGISFHSSIIQCQTAKKDTSGPLPRAYEPAEVEAGWYHWWESQNYFKLRSSLNDSQGSRPFSMILPPPNITGTLHLGHALTITVQDVIARWQRMSGKEVLWIPGTDHAGIATQVVVEKQTWAKLKLTRHQLGREKFLQEIEKWRQEKGSHIQNQLRLMGASLDWSREYFTMDKVQSVAVVEAFIRLFEEGLIYRSNVPVSWSCWLQSTISDVEIENHEVSGPTAIQVPGYENSIQFGTLTNIVYKTSNNDAEIVVSTTRPETMLGDAAIAVHPNDPRYTHLHGSYFWHPYRRIHIPLICDDFVDQSFGTGAVKITPAHDKTDFEVAKRHHLELIEVFNEFGVIHDNFKLFKGMKRFNARENIVKDLANKGLIQREEPHKMVIPICGRSGDIVEFIPKPQWFLSTKDMACKAIKAVREKNLRFFPKEAEQNWYQWFENNQDWCLSRQLWWGHRIPAYKCSINGGVSHKWFAAASELDAKVKASSYFSCQASDPRLDALQDEDVLDTWFSSSLLPFSSLGWPGKTDELERLYPLSIMETGNDILLFWVARMVILGEHLTNKLPFKDVFLHGVVRDSSGRKMSKSIGNVVAPEDIREGRSVKELLEKVHSSHKEGVIASNELKNAIRNQLKMFPDGIPQCGTDALRFSLLSHPINGHFIDFNVNDCHTFRRFCNKIWQACRYIEGVVESPVSMISLEIEDQKSFSLMDFWILSKFSHLIVLLDMKMNKIALHECVQGLHHFAHNEFCDVYLESTKSVWNGDDVEAKRTTRNVLVTCIENLLVALSPFMPYLTEELYQRASYIQKKFDSIMLYPYPQPKEWLNWQNVALEREVDFILQAATAVRKLKKNNGLKRSDKVSVLLSSKSEHDVLYALKHKHLLETFSNCNVTDVRRSTDDTSNDFMTEERLGDVCLVKILLEDENQRISHKHRRNLVTSALNKQSKLEKEIARTREILKSPKFWTNAPEDVKLALPKKLTVMEEEFQKTETFLNQESELRDCLKEEIAIDKSPKKRKA